MKLLNINRAYKQRDDIRYFLFAKMLFIAYNHVKETLYLHNLASLMLTSGAIFLDTFFNLGTICDGVLFLVTLFKDTPFAGVVGVIGTLGIQKLFQLRTNRMTYKMKEIISPLTDICYLENIPGCSWGSATAKATAAKRTAKRIKKLAFMIKILEIIKSYNLQPKGFKSLDSYLDVQRWKINLMQIRFSGPFIHQLNIHSHWNNFKLKNTVWILRYYVKVKFDQRSRFLTNAVFRICTNSHIRFCLKKDKFF